MEKRTEPVECDGPTMHHAHVIEIEGESYWNPENGKLSRG